MHNKNSQGILPLAAFGIAYVSGLRGGIHRADTRTGAALNALCGVDNVFIAALGDALFGAFLGAGSATDALVTDYICH